MRQLILGGARSGKSRIAQERAAATTSPVIYIATARVGDTEMEQRIELHRQNRPAEWQVLEVPEALPAELKRLSGQGCTVLVDCLTLWLTNLLLQSEQTMQQGMAELTGAVAQFQGDLILVSNEVGWGIVPMGELSRQFQDNTGRLHQDLAALVERVTLSVAGIALEVKGGE
ncbi:bifunctional adenosylcobinamide kinase/adenosylcobinamide-phosphate guanylyltransferase [Neptuniibacter halophilus]|uniref:bifunctional adenosylcobinamide kinase/adenosylcobinamide-phosphate guanylyltransferase n=1 Tax=Neptuniibacter halophilus TaxID=651666 RepID=UPI0025747553|nr:bifunctional adenosylcobinamide kinase/adenosylcobinamide-phosphate guanylyltransferase [Neptuniibacter halophilus]